MYFILYSGFGSLCVVFPAALLLLYVETYEFHKA